MHIVVLQCTEVGQKASSFQQSSQSQVAKVAKVAVSLLREMTTTLSFLNGDVFKLDSLPKAAVLPLDKAVSSELLRNFANYLYTEPHTLGRVSVFFLVRSSLRPSREAGKHLCLSVHRKYSAACVSLYVFLGAHRYLHRRSREHPRR